MLYIIFYGSPAPKYNPRFILHLKEQVQMQYKSGIVNLRGIQNILEYAIGKGIQP